MPEVVTEQTEQPRGRLAENIVYFARALRKAGIPVGPGSVMDALEAVHTAGIGTREDFYWTLHSVFIKRHEQTFLFDQAFQIFFKRRNYLEQLMGMTMPQVETGLPDNRKEASQRVQEALFSGMGEKLQREVQELEIDMRQTVSDMEILQKKDFAQMSAAEVAAAKNAIQRLVLPLDDIKTRRLAPHRHGHIIDMRRTLRASMKSGGDFIDLKYRGPKTK
ncbi:MAG TPA: VWA domain-containing protein, partial [Xanthobacteraceae bacterium]|nr:VWA domain-containing protein [Xanthobacteraceae bacterium]